MCIVQCTLYGYPSKVLGLPESKTQWFLLVWCSLLPLPHLHHYSPSEWRSAKHSFGLGSRFSDIRKLIGLTSCSPAGTAFSKSPLPIPNLAKDLKFGGYRLSCGKGNNDTIIQVDRVITEDKFHIWVHSIFIKGLATNC